MPGWDCEGGWVVASVQQAWFDDQICGIDRLRLVFVCTKVQLRVFTVGTSPLSTLQIA